MLNSNRFLLDTHAWVWLLNGNDRLKESASFSSILRAAQKSGLFLCAISLWEVAMLEAKGRLTLSTGIANWMNEAVSAPGLQIVPLIPQIVIDSTRLPGDFHGDPVDRLIVATARYLKCPLLTADGKIEIYGKSGHCQVTPIV